MLFRSQTVFRSLSPLLNRFSAFKEWFHAGCRKHLIGCTREGTRPIPRRVIVLNLEESEQRSPSGTSRDLVSIVHDNTTEEGELKSWENAYDSQTFFQDLSVYLQTYDYNGKLRFGCEWLVFLAIRLSKLKTQLIIRKGRALVAIYRNNDAIYRNPRTNLFVIQKIRFARLNPISHHWPKAFPRCKTVGFKRDRLP